MAIRPETRAKLFAKISASELLEEKRKKEYIQERDAYKASEKGQFEQKVRFATQAVTREEEKIYASYLEAAAKLKENIYNLIEEYLLNHHSFVEQASVEEIEQALRHLEIAISKLKKMCDNYQKFTNPNSKFLSEYEKLFNELIEMDIRFALFAPKRSLNKKNIKFFKMPEELKDRMFNHLEELEITFSMQYLETYAADFKNQIKERGIEL